MKEAKTGCRELLLKLMWMGKKFNAGDTKFLLAIKDIDEFLLTQILNPNSLLMLIETEKTRKALLAGGRIPIEYSALSQAFTSNRGFVSA
ncbi:hypothetical protein NPIL_438751 [Nephila pilipes]|uniref:Uncharacterized protein n=1 Tax=Nephila pilipes TaxID=299642 RepID=A0A8X6R1W3_NEPPI|nr:hypothetical protein NPIL_438751 [Nephila pilipes]